MRKLVERHHVLPVGAEHGVAERLLDGVGAAEHGGDARAEEHRRGGHERGAHDDVPQRLHHQHALLLAVLDHAGRPQPARGRVDAEGRRERAAAHGAP